MKLLLVLLFTLPAIAADKMRVVSYGAGALKLGVSTDRVQFGLEQSTNRAAWTDSGRTWILRGGTNEVVITVPVVPARAVYVRMVP